MGAGAKPVIIIEHLEDSMGIWVFLEYRHSSLIYGKNNIWFTNVPKKYHGLISRYGRAFRESVVELVRNRRLHSNEILVLDPRAEKSLSYSDLLEYRYIVIGGILGDHPPRGRTYELLTSRLPSVESRNIGEGQYSIDGAVYYVDYLWRNRSLNSYRYVDGVYIETEHGSIYLPFRYPVENGKPVLAPGLADYLRGRGVSKSILDELRSSK